MCDFLSQVVNKRGNQFRRAHNFLLHYVIC